MVSIAREAWFSDPALQRLLTLLNGEGGETRIVGGAVRNALMGEPVHEVDLATTLTPEAVMARGADAGIKAVPTGIAHGTVTLVVAGRGYEVTTLRRDVSTDGRRAEVEFGEDWQVDAERRDLTINALYATADGSVIDLVGGLADIDSRTVRFIGDAATRIAEDHLRILRFFRFFAWYGTGRPDAEALRASARAKASLDTLSAERVWSELKKLLAAPDPGRALLWMRQAGVLTQVLPETEKWGIDAIPGLIAAEKALGWTVDPLLRLVSMLPRDGERLAALATRLRLSKQEAGVLATFAGAPDIRDDLAGAALDRLLYRHGRTGIRLRLMLATAAARVEGGTSPADWPKLARYADLLKRCDKFEKPGFPLSGKDLMTAGIPAGPELGALLKDLEERWIERNFALDKAQLLALATRPA